MKAVKGNKEYMIDESQAKAYKDAGFDIYDASGKQVAWGRGKTVAYEEHMRAVEEIGRLQELATKRYEENESLKQEIEALKSRFAGQQAEPQKSGKKTAGKEESE